MKIIVEEFQYRTEEAKIFIKKVFPLEEENVMQLSLVGYYYSTKLGDTLFFLPKVVIDEKGYLLGKYDPEKVIDFSRAYQEGTVSKDDYGFIYGLSVWVYRAINVFHNDHANDEINKEHGIVYSRKALSLGISGVKVYNSFLDVMLSLIRFNRENQNFFTFTIRNIHSGVNHINWSKTVNYGKPFFQDDTPIYMDMVNKKKQIDYKEELFIIFFSILQHLEFRYGFPVEIDYGYDLLSEDEMDNYLDGYGAMRLEQIRYRYFSDKEILLWNLCYDFFIMAYHAQANDAEDDYLLVKNFNIVFEAMIDKLLSEKNDSRITKLKLKEQPDGKIVDHIYSYQGLIYNEDQQKPADIYYIGDSKYYKLGNNLGENSIYKQYTYARNVIQANLNLFNTDENHTGAGKDYLIYRDDITEGYNITPNFFIRGHIDLEDKDYDNDKLKRTTNTKGEDRMDVNFHFKNRLFDRDTLLLEHFSVNFLFVLAVYGSDNNSEQEEFCKKAHKMFRENIMEEIEHDYHFFSLQMKTGINFDSDDDEGQYVDKLAQLIEQKYFHRLLGKAFRPFKSEKFLYLSLNKAERYYEENMKLLGILSNDFYIRKYRLGTNPTEELNHYIKLIGQPQISGSTNGYKFKDFSNDTFLIGGYRTDKKQEEWIKTKKFYNIREGYNRRGAKILDENATTARFLLLYKIENPEKYSVYEIDSWKVKDAEWMSKNDYTNPNGFYIVYTIKGPVYFEEAMLAAMLRCGAVKAVEKGTEEQQSKWREKTWRGAPVFLKGREIVESCLPNHKNVKKAIVVVSINDKNLDNMTKGYSAGMFVTLETEQVVKDFSAAQYVVYSNKQRNKVFRIVGEPRITDSVPNGYTQHKYGRMLKNMNVPKRKQSQEYPDFYLSFELEEIKKTLDQKEINVIPEGLSGYDTRVIDI